MQVTLTSLKIKILTSIVIGRNIMIGDILRHYDDNDAVVTSHGCVKTMIKKYSTFLQAKRNCSRDFFIWKQMTRLH